MKNVILVSILLAILSCGKDNDDATTTTATFSMKVNNVLWTTNTVNNMADNNNAIINAVNTSAGEVFGVTIGDFKGVGDYPVSGGSTGTLTLYTRKDKKQFNTSTEIQYKITQVDGTKIHGTFSGSIKSSDGEVLTITEGKF